MSNSLSKPVNPNCAVCGDDNDDGLFFCDKCISHRIENCIEALRCRKYFNHFYEIMYSIPS